MKLIVLALALSLGPSLEPAPAARSSSALRDLDPKNNVHLAGALSAARVLCGEREGTTQASISAVWDAARRDGAGLGRSEKEVDQSISAIMNVVLVEISASKAATVAFCAPFGERLP